MRLFIAIPLPDDVSRNLGGLLDLLRPVARLKWNTVSNLHITTKFIGEWPEDRVDELVRAIRPAGDRPPISIKVSGIGWLPNPHSPRVLFASVQGGTELAELAAATDAATATLGVERETREFQPHLTLARIRESGHDLPALRRKIAQLPSADMGSFIAHHFSLYRSDLQPSGSIYTQLAEIPFAG